MKALIICEDPSRKSGAQDDTLDFWGGSARYTEPFN
jgi:hypothetical protein